MLVVFGIITVFYAGFIGLIAGGVLFGGRRRVSSPTCQGISVIIAARNEAANLPGLIEHLRRVNYPPEQYEFIIVNDHSTDASMAILDPLRAEPNFLGLDFQEREHLYTGKKAALMYGIDRSRFDILAFTDADALPNANWLRAIDRAMDEQTDYAVGLTVLLDRKKPRTFRLKTFERCVYAALCAGGLAWKIPITSFAGNHAYRKDLFRKAGAFDGIGHLRSGDDDLLLMKMMPHIRTAGFVYSPEMKMNLWDGADRKTRHQTNIRRASKFTCFPWWLRISSSAAFIYWILVYLVVGLWLFSLWHPGTESIAGSHTVLTMLAVKTGAELILLTSFLARVRLIKLLVLYPVQILLFPLQFIFYALRGTLGSYQWK